MPFVLGVKACQIGVVIVLGETVRRDYERARKGVKREKLRRRLCELPGITICKAPHALWWSGVYDVTRRPRSSTHGDSLKRYESSTSEQGELEQAIPL